MREKSGLLRDLPGWNLLIFSWKQPTRETREGMFFGFSCDPPKFGVAGLLRVPPMESESIVYILTTWNVGYLLRVKTFCGLLGHIYIHLKRIRWFPRTDIYCPQVRTFCPTYLTCNLSHQQYQYFTGIILKSLHFYE